MGHHEHFLKMRPHWSVMKKEEQYERIDRGAEIPFDISLPLPARDSHEGSDKGVRLFWDRFSCQNCGRCCFTPGAGLVLEQDDFERIAGSVGKKRLMALCRRNKGQGIWILKQPCPFYDARNSRCQIYDIRPATCAKYPLHPPPREMPYNLAVDAFCPGARQLAKDILGWWIICEYHWAEILSRFEAPQEPR